MQGTVVAIRAAGGRRVAVVEVSAEQVCQRCASGKGCGAGIGLSATSLKQIEVPLGDSHNLREGQSVELRMQDGGLLRAAAVVYGWPLLGGLLGAAVGLSRSEASAALLALCGMLAGWLLASWYLKQSRCLQRLVPVISA
ncbi:MAG: SoxR reducing system RseC family protein [Woeseiaceae bacterium]